MHTWKSCSYRFRSAESIRRPRHLACNSGRRNKRPRFKVAMTVHAHRQTAELSGEQVEQYFDRISLPSTVRERIQAEDLGFATLTAVCKAHVQSIPFENLDLVYEPAKQQSGGEIRIDPESIFTKLVSRRRGGYCFEINALLAHALRRIGYGEHMYTAAGRVVQERKSRDPTEVELGGIDHQVVFVQCDGRKWLCDCGFGGQTCRAPIPLEGDSSAGSEGSDEGTHKVRRGVLGSTLPGGDVQAAHREGWYMQRYSKGRRRWDDLYFFTEQEWREIDYAIPNFYCYNRHPIFCKKLVVALQTEDGRKTINGTRMRIVGANGSTEEDLVDPSDLEQALKDHFGLEVAANK